MFEPPDEPAEPSGREELNFFEELDRLATGGSDPAFTVVLQSGDRYRVDRPGQLAVFRTMYVHYPSYGTTVMFPFPSVCAVEIHDAVKS